MRNNINMFGKSVGKYAILSLLCVLRPSMCFSLCVLFILIYLYDV